MAYCRSLPKYKHRRDDSLSSNSSFVSVKSVTEPDSKEACAMCAFSGKGNIREASYYCLSCSVFGRFICSSCIPRHTQETANHVLKHIPDFNENMSLNAWKNADDAERLKKVNEELQKHLLEEREKLKRLNEELEIAKSDTEMTKSDIEKATISTKPCTLYVKEQRKRTRENLSRYKNELSKTEINVAENRTKISLLEDRIKDLEKTINEMRQNKETTNTETDELTVKVLKLKEEKNKLEREKEIYVQTIDNLNKQISAEELARESLERLDEISLDAQKKALDVEKLKKENAELQNKLEELRLKKDELDSDVKPLV